MQSGLAARSVEIILDGHARTIVDWRFAAGLRVERAPQSRQPRQRSRCSDGAIGRSASGGCWRS